MILISGPHLESVVDPQENLGSTGKGRGANLLADSHLGEPLLIAPAEVRAERGACRLALDTRYPEPNSHAEVPTKRVGYPSVRH